MTDLTSEILAWLAPLKSGCAPDSKKLRIEYDQALSVGSELRSMGFELERVRVPNSYLGRHGGYTQKWTAYDYMSPQTFSPKLRIIVLASATHRPFSGSVRVEEIKEKK